MRLAVSLIGASLLLTGAALAQTPAPAGDARAAVGQACAADFQKLCPDAKGPERRRCLQDNNDKVSDGCKSAIAAMQQQGAPR